MYYMNFSGRYDIKVYQNHLSLHGKTYDYKIPIKTIMRLFLLPHKDGRHMYFVVSYFFFSIWLVFCKIPFSIFALFICCWLTNSGFCLFLSDQPQSSD